MQEGRGLTMARAKKKPMPLLTPRTAPGRKVVKVGPILPKKRLEFFDVVDGPLSDGIVTMTTSGMTTSGTHPINPKQGAIWFCDGKLCVYSGKTWIAVDPSQLVDYVKKIHIPKAWFNNF